MPLGSLILTGAPRKSTLDDADLVQSPPPFITPRVSTASAPVSWRSLAPLTGPGSMREPSMYTGGYIDRHSALIVDTDEETQLDFYDHSFAFYESISSSAQSDGDTLNDSTSFWEGDTDDAPERGPNPLATVGHLSDLEDIPDPGYVQSIAPHIVTVNLIVAIINLAPRRRVRTRWDREMDIVEMLVGDETRAGFRITCWLPATKDWVKESRLEESLSGLRPRDIVLFRSIALSTFHQQVYGQSRNYLTKVDLLSRRPIDSTDTEGVLKWKTVTGNSDGDPQLVKIQKVRQWVLNFIAPVAEASMSSEEAVQQLPSDTQ